MGHLIIRHAVPGDAKALADIEAASYPEAEAASYESILHRIEMFPECFWILEPDDITGETIVTAAASGRTVRITGIASFINGMATDIENLEDVMYDDAGMHDENGAWQMIFSVVTDEKYRGLGLAGMLMKRVIEDSEARGRKGIVLTCKDALVGFYAGFGYADEGISASEHGGVKWHQMRLRF